MLRIQKRKLREGFLLTRLWSGFCGLKGRKFLSVDLMNSKPCELVVVNQSESDIIVCWVDQAGKLYHFRPVNNGSIRDGSVSNVLRENTVTGHAFVGFKSLKVTGRKKLLPVRISEITAQVS